MKNEILASEIIKKTTGKESWEFSRTICDIIYGTYNTCTNFTFGYIIFDDDNNDYIVIPISIPDAMTGNSRKWKISLHLKSEDPKFVLSYNKKEIIKSEKFSEIINTIIKMNTELRDKYLASKKNAAQNKGDIRYIIATAIREEGLKRDVKFESAVTGEDAYKIMFTKHIDTLYYGKQALYIKVDFDTESNARIELGSYELIYKLSMADPNFDPNKLVALVFYLVDDVVKAEEKSYKYQKNYFNDIIQNWFKEKV